MTAVPDPADTADRELRLTRVLKAPRDLVFRVWMDKEHISRWWGPTGFTTTTHSFENRVGGIWRFTMHGPDGTDYENTVRYTEIDPPARVAYDHGDGSGVENPHFRAVTTFEEVAGGTLVTLRMIFPTKEARDATEAAVGAIEGGNQTLARMEAVVRELGGG